MLDIKPPPYCGYCEHFTETGFTIDSTAPTQWQSVKRHGKCALGQRYYSKDDRVPTYHSCGEWQQKKEPHAIRKTQDNES